MGRNKVKLEQASHLVPTTFLHSDVKQGAFRARKNDDNGRSAEHHASTTLIRIRQE
jgi:hypothetical protein